MTERQVHRDILRKEATVSLDRAVVNEDADRAAELIDRAAACLRQHDEIVPH